MSIKYLQMNCCSFYHKLKELHQPTTLKSPLKNKLFSVLTVSKLVDVPMHIKPFVMPFRQQLDIETFPCIEVTYYSLGTFPS